MLISADEIYALTTYNFEDFISMGIIYPEGTYVTNGLSKDRSAGGYRLGTCILPERFDNNLTKDFIKVAATLYTNVSTPTQYAAVSAYEPNDEVDKYFGITREIHRMMGHCLSYGFNKIEGIKATQPQGAFYFYVDFNQLSIYLKKKGVNSSNELGLSLLGHPFHIATVTGDAVMNEADNYGGRIAFVDYDGKKAFENYKKDPPINEDEEIVFVKKNEPRMVKGVGVFSEFVDQFKQ